MDNGWTIAYRKPRANRFIRVSDWEGSWQEAYDVAGIFSAVHPELQVYYVPSADHEANEQRQIESGELRDFGYSADWGNVLVDSGKRVKIIEGGALNF